MAGPIPFTPVVPLLNGNVYLGTLLVTRPNDTTAYTTGDGLVDTTGQAIMKIANVGRNYMPGYGGDNNGIIRSVRVSSSDTVTAANLKILFSAVPFAYADNAVFVSPGGLSGLSDVQGWADVTPAANALGGFNDGFSAGLAIPYSLPAGQTDLYIGIGVKVGFTPIANAQYRVTVGFERS